jgi:hypothetical protein
MFDRYLNKPSGGAVDYEPASSLVVLMFADIAQLKATQPPDVRMGYMEEREVALWTCGHDRVSDTFSVYNPYMIVDHPWAMAMGREVYGFPKQLGTVTLPRDDDSGSYALDLYGVTVWGPEEKTTMHRLLDVIQTGEDVDPAPREFGSQREMVDAITAIVAAQRAGIQTDATPDSLGSRVEGDARALDMLSSGVLPIVLLKQIRDARTPLYACYQAVQLADFEVVTLRGARLLPGKYSVEIEDLVNEPLRRELGFAPGPLTPVTAFQVDFDFRVTVAQELWRADTATPVVTVARATA